MDRSPEELLLDHLPQAVDGEVALPADLAHALDRDEELRARWDRWVRQARALTGLVAEAAPLDLEGRVVAATQGGHRQQRATEQVAGLWRFAAPDELERRVRHAAELPFPDSLQQDLREQLAPQELDRRVEQELADLPASTVRRFTGRLSRRRAPQDLTRRLSDRPGGGRRIPGLVTALTVVSVLAVGGWLRFGRVDAAAPEFRFEIVDLEDPMATDSDGRALRKALGDLTGGVLEGSRR